MKRLLIMNMKANRDANETVLRLLDGLSEEERNKSRGSYYKSLSGLAAHLVGGGAYFHRLFRESGVGGAVQETEKLEVPSGEILTAAQWEELKRVSILIDNASVAFVEGLEDDDLERIIALPWFGGKPATVSLYYVLNAYVNHGVHHRGQISQVLDEMGVKNDYSGIDPRHQA